MNSFVRLNEEGCHLAQPTKDQLLKARILMDDNILNFVHSKVFDYYLSIKEKLVYTDIFDDMYQDAIMEAYYRLCFYNGTNESGKPCKPTTYLYFYIEECLRTTAYDLGFPLDLGNACERVRILNNEVKKYSKTHNVSLEEAEDNLSPLKKTTFLQAKKSLCRAIYNDGGQTCPDLSHVASRKNYAKEIIAILSNISFINNIEKSYLLLRYGMPNATKSEIKDILIKEFDASPADLVAIDRKIAEKFSKELENEQTIELVSLLNSAIREERAYA